LVVGKTGTGKSTFINKMTGSNLPVSDEAYSCTKFIQIVDAPTFLVVDTPGVGKYRIF